MDVPSPPAVLMESEVARQLRVSKFTVQRMRKAGKIKFKLVGRRVRYTQAHVDEFLAASDSPLSSGKAPSSK